MNMAGNRLCIGAVALLTAAGVALIAPSVASAHQNASGADCSGIYGNAWIFDDFDTNAMTIYLDGNVAYTVADFGGGHEHRIDVPQDGQEHQWRVVIDSSNDTWDSTVSGTVGPCGETTTTIEPPTLATHYDCMSDGPAAGTLSPSSGNWTATGDLDPSKLGVRIDVTAATGYTFSGGQTVSLTATASEDDGCEAAPAQPALTVHPECGVVDTYTIPATTGVVYLVDGTPKAAGTYDLQPGTTVTITAAAAAGYRLTSPLSMQLTGGPDTACVRPGTPTLNETSVCGEVDTYTIPSTTGVVYLVDGTPKAAGTYALAEGVTVVITAQAADGYALVGELTKSFTGGDVEACPPTEWEPPTPGAVCGANNDPVTIPSDTNVVDYADSGWISGLRTVTARWTADGRVLETWTYSDIDVPCPPVEWEPPTAEPVCGPDNDTVDVPEDTDDVHYADTGWVDGVRTVTARWTQDDSVLGTWHFTDENVSCPPGEWPVPSSEPVCGADNDTVTVPADTDEVTFMDSGWDKGVRTVMAHWTHDQSELDSWEFIDAGEACPPPTTVPQSLDIVAMGPVCLRDAPYIEVTFGDQPQFNGRTATVTFVDLDGDVVGTETATYQAGATVRFVYPGATVDAAGNAVDWPGWMFDGTVWVHDPSDAHLRDGLTVVVEVNPTATGSVTYPDATAACADPATVPPTPTDPVVPQGGLPVTR
jgi:hypothetical protein